MKFKKTDRKLLMELRDRFIDGEKLTVEELLQDYFSPKTPYAYLVAKRTVKGWLQGSKIWFKRTAGIWFGNIDNDGHYGVITSEEEVRFAMIRYYRYIKGNLNSASVLMGDAKSKGLLPSGITRERMLVAKLADSEKGKEKKNEH